MFPLNATLLPHLPTRPLPLAGGAGERSTANHDRLPNIERAVRCRAEGPRSVSAGTVGAELFDEFGLSDLSELAANPQQDRIARVVVIPASVSVLPNSGCARPRRAIDARNRRRRPRRPAPCAGCQIDVREAVARCEHRAPAVMDLRTGSLRRDRRRDRSDRRDLHRQTACRRACCRGGSAHRCRA